MLDLWFGLLLWFSGLAFGLSFGYTIAHARLKKDER